MNKRITSLLLSFVMIFAMFATAAPVSAEPATSTFTFTVEADKTTAGPGDTVTFTVYIQQTGTMTCFQGKLGIPSGLTYVVDSGALTEGIQEKLGRDEVAWTQDPYKLLSAFGAEDFTGTDKIAVMTFQCTVDNDTAAGNYEVTLLEIEADGGSTENYETKNPTCIPATITVAAAPKPATGITLNKSELTLVAGAVDDSLKATVTPADSTDTVVWSSDKPAVATVDPATGKVTAVAPGEAIITATAGTKTATCKVTVNCGHGSFTLFPEKESNCTEKGWDAYKKCDLCGKLFDMSDNPLTGIPYRATNDDHDFNTSEWGYKEADGHAHVCSRNAAHHDTVMPHTAGPAATETTPQTCTECGFVMQAATGHVHANHLTKVDKVDATCANDATHSAKDDAAAADKFYNGKQGAHVYGSEWVDCGETGHAHKCQYHDAYDAVQPHTPDHEGGATYDYAVKCTDCGRVLEPQRENGSIRVEVPFKLTVKKTGEMDPGQKTFKFAIDRFGAPTVYTLVQDTVETNGEKTYEGKFIFTISKDQAGNLSEGFVIHQVKGNAAGWTYDESIFYAMPLFVDSYDSVRGWAFFKFDEKGELEYNNPMEEIGFTNSYSAKKPVTPPAPEPPEKPVTPPAPETPKTGDGSMIAFSIAMAIVSGAALMGAALYSRRRSR